MGTVRVLLEINDCTLAPKELETSIETSIQELDEKYGTESRIVTIKEI